VYELDQTEVLEHKRGVLREIQPLAERVAVPADLSRDFSAALQAAGYDPRVPSVWLVEGLLQYLEAASVLALFERIDALSAPRSRLLYDVVGRSLLEAPMLAATLRMMQELGAPWRFGTDQPQQLAGTHGWSVNVIDPGEVGNRWGRWPFPAAPLSMRGIPRGYLLEASKP
jgi:methyltransferase (TIGR00027 family)